MGHMAVASIAEAISHPVVINYDGITLTKVFLFLGYLFFGWGSQLFINEANRLKKPSKVMPYSYMTIIVSVIADVYLFETSFNFIIVVGILLTSSGLLGKYLIERHENRKNGSAALI